MLPHPIPTCPAAGVDALTRNLLFAPIDDEETEEVLERLGRVLPQDPRALATVQLYLSHPRSGSVVQKAFSVLHNQPSTTPEFGRWVMTMAWRGRYGTYREGAVALIRRYWQRETEAIEILRRCTIFDGDEAIALRCLSVLAEARIVPPQVRAWFKQLQGNAHYPHLRIGALEALAGLGEDPQGCCEELRALAIGASDEEHRLAAVEALGHVGPDDPRSIVVMRDRLEHDSSAEVRGAALQQLCRLGVVRRTERGPLLEVMVRDPAPVASTLALHLAAELLSRDDELPQFLLRIVQSNCEPWIRTEAMAALASAGLAERAHDGFWAELANSDPEPEVRLEAVALLVVATDPQAAVAVAALEQTFDRGCADVKRSILRRLVWRPALASKFRTVFFAYARDSADPALRKAAISGIARLWPEHRESFDLVTSIVLTDPASEMRRHALKELLYLSLAGWAVVSVVRRAFERDTDSEVRGAALHVIASETAGNHECWEWLLEQARNSPDVSVRWMASALAMWDPYWTEGAISVAAGMATEHPTSWARMGAVQCLGRRAGHRSSARAIVLGRLRNDPCSEVRDAAVNCVPWLEGSRSACIRALQRAARQDPDADVRTASINILAEWWGHDRRPRRTLHRALVRDRSPEVRSAALDRIRRARYL